ncbi:MAG: hypothetical protein M1840_001967 [Geoglossum simile]|nr:MAG: hypothetical protein M1840_001967 [Geoglossum simile]
MANQQESSAFDGLNSHLNSITARLEKQSEALSSLVKAVNATRGIQPTVEMNNRRNGNPDWVLDADEDVNLHFAEFHSDDSNKKDTAMISATNDPIRAIKKAYQAWQRGDYETRDTTKVFVSIIYSSLAASIILPEIQTPRCGFL